MRISNVVLVTLVTGLLASCNSSPDNSQNHSEGTHNTSSSTNTGMNGLMDEMMKDMHSIKMTGNTDVDFALMMKSHHEGAVDMAQEVLDKGSNEQVKALAEKIVDAQKSEIESLDKFISNQKGADKNYSPDKKDEGFGSVMNKSMEMMMTSSHSEVGTVDKQFIEMMIPHHQSAVYMAEGFLKYGKDPSLKELASKMIADQNHEITEMKGIAVE